MNFRELGLIDPILKALEQEGYTTPTPIQQGAIPPALAGRDVDVYKRQAYAGVDRSGAVSITKGLCPLHLFLLS